MQLCITNDACQVHMDPQYRYLEKTGLFFLTDIPYNCDNCDSWKWFLSDMFCSKMSSF